jgi:hypothetical protein
MHPKARSPVGLWICQEVVTHFLTASAASPTAAERGIVKNVLKQVHNFEEA